VEALRNEREELARINGKLGEDLEACLAHLDNLGLINNKVSVRRFSWSSTCRTSAARTRA
jgi:hypothetical protein